MEQNKGIDYGYGTSNIDTETGIRYGVISSHSLMPEASNEIWAEGSVYIAHCPECGNELEEVADELYDGESFECEACDSGWTDEDVYGDEPSYIEYHEITPDGEIIIIDCFETDYMIIKSPYVTRGVYCSPCVPGGIDLDSPLETGELAYCLPSDFFEEGKMPYTYEKASK